MSCTLPPVLLDKLLNGFITVSLHSLMDYLNHSQVSVIQHYEKVLVKDAPSLPLSPLIFV